MVSLSFAARKWFSAVVTIARRCDGRAWNVRHTKFPNLIPAFRPMRKAEQHLEEWQAAVEALLLVVEFNGPTMMGAHRRAESTEPTRPARV